MNPGLAILVSVVFVVMVAFLVASIFGSGTRIAYYVHRAVRAVETRDYDRAEAYYRKLATMWPKFRDPKQRADIEFVAEYGLGLCFQHRDDFAAAEASLKRADELLSQGVDQSCGVRAALLAELAVSQRGRNKQAECEQTLLRLRQCCDTAEESDIDQISELVTGVSAGASYRQFKDLAFEIVSIAKDALERSQAWHDGSMAHIQISLASFHMMYCEYGPARELIKTAVETAGDELDRSDLDNAYFQLGWIHVLKADLDEARAAFQRSLDIRIEEDGPQHWRTSIAVSALADANRVYGDSRAAIDYSNQAWLIQSEQLAEDDGILAGTAMNRSMLLMDLGRFDEAERLLDRAGAVAMRGANTALLAGIRLAQGISAYSRFLYEDADKLLRDGLEIAENNYGEGDRMTCDHLAILAANVLNLQKYQESEELVTNAIAIRETQGDVSVIDMADALNILADVYVETDRLESAESTIRRSLTLIDDRVAPTHLIRSDISETRGRISHLRSDSAAALEHFEQALEVRRKVQQPDHPRWVKLLEDLASCLESGGRSEDADKYRRHARLTRERYS